MTHNSKDGDGFLNSPTLLEELCRVTHLCWREKKIREGWQPGTLDERARVHDALVPFEELTKRDRHVLCVAVEADEVEKFLAGIVEYERGPERLFMIDEMHEGMRVGMSKSDEPSDDDDILGTVTGWDVDPDSGELESIDVRWDDGEVRRYHPEVRELRRLEE